MCQASVSLGFLLVVSLGMRQLGRAVVLQDNSMYVSGYNCSTIRTLSINLFRIYMIRRIVMQVYINAMCSSCYCYGY